MMRIAVILIVLAFARTAYAGYCLDAGEAGEYLKEVEAFVKDKSKTPDWQCIEIHAPELKSRIEKACRKILDRDGVKSPCARLAASAGFAKLGDHDLYPAVTEKQDDPVSYEMGFGVTQTRLLGRMRDPRALPVILQLWKDAIPRAEEREKKKKSMMAWSVWRQDAAEVLGAVGGKDDIAFLDEQAKATKDKFVAKACRDAIAAIEKRLAPPPEPKKKP